MKIFKWIMVLIVILAISFTVFIACEEEDDDEDDTDDDSADDDSADDDDDSSQGDDFSTVCEHLIGCGTWSSMDSCASSFYEAVESYSCDLSKLVKCLEDCISTTSEDCGDDWDNCKFQCYEDEEICTDW